ncbi:MAG: hypothetical protein V3U54_08725 [Thermodesulfobacteriota bacterium]
MNKVTKYQCLQCDGKGQVARLRPPLLEKGLDKRRDLIPYRDTCGVCKGGWVTRNTLKEQVLNQFGKNNLEKIEIFEERMVDK